MAIFPVISPIPLSRELLDFARVFREAGHSLFFVGGAIRDSLLGRRASDFDAATDARPEEVVALFRRVIPTGIKHGTVTVLWKGQEIETTTFRAEAGYSDGRHPDQVRFGVGIEEDLARRDFTINAMAYEPFDRRIVDPHGGAADLRAQLIRAVGEASERFDEDGLRVLRAARFASQLGFAIEASTLAAMALRRERVESLSPERIRDELSKILLSPNPSRGLRILEETGILAAILPELVEGRGVEQKGSHLFDVLDHSLLALDAAKGGLELRLAALFHDLGKPRAKAIGADGVPTFHRHEEISATMTEAVLRRLRYPNATIDTAVHLVAQHMFNYDDSWSDGAVRRFVARVGRESLEGLYALRRADASGMAGVETDGRNLGALRTRVEDLLASDSTLGLKDLAIGGKELADIGVPRGPVMGRMLAELLEAVLDDPGLNNPERLLEIAGLMKGKHGLGP
ncbi:MAG: CCA tRNA nucleotidyltransferase [Spirochaetota bacterium]